MRNRVRTIALVTGLAGLACAQAGETGRDVAHRLNPVAAAEVAVLDVRVHGPYRRVEVRGRGTRLALLAPEADANCQALLRPEAKIVYRRHGLFGRFERDGTICDPVGVASLAAWRNRHPRADTRGRPVPRATARFREIYRDDQVALARGRFPLAGRVGIPAGFDLVALIPLTEACRAPLARGEASLEFVPAGREAFRLVGDRALCPVLGFAMPVAESGS
jgi:hypothetical protein